MTDQYEYKGLTIELTQSPAIREWKWAVYKDVNDGGRIGRIGWAPDRTAAKAWAEQFVDEHGDRLWGAKK